MDLEEKVELVKEWFAKHGDREYLATSKVKLEEWLHQNRTLSSYLYIANLLKDPSKFSIQSEHDVIYLASLDEVANKMFESDVVYLLRMGIHYDEETESLADFT